MSKFSKLFVHSASRRVLSTPHTPARGTGEGSSALLSRSLSGQGGRAKAVGVLAILLAFSGCAAPSTTESTVESRNGSLVERTYDLKDGRTVRCMTYKDGYAGGLSCDWEGAR